jgi:hypothetical protein
MIARFRILVLNVVAVAGATVALLPILVRRRPLGRRVRAAAPGGRVVPLAERRRASPS